MSFDINQFIPNFTLFVFILAPMIITILFVMTVASKWFQGKARKKKRRSWAQLIGYIPAIYLVSPVIEIYQYLVGERASFVPRLFGYHFPILMFLIICTGIGQVCYYWVSMGPAGEVVE